MYPPLESEVSADDFVRLLAPLVPNLLEKILEKATLRDGRWSEELSAVTFVVLLRGNNDIALAQLPV